MVVKDMFKAAENDNLEKFSIAFAKDEMNVEEEIRAALEIFKLITKEPEYKHASFVDVNKEKLRPEFVEEMNDELGSENWEIVQMTYSEIEEEAINWFLKKEDGKYRIFDPGVISSDELYK